MKYGVVNYPVKVIDEEIINALADIEIHHEEDKRIVLVECVMNYTDLPEECILEIGYLKRKFKLMHTESVASESDIYKLKFMFERVEDINKKDEWWDSLRSIVRYCMIWNEEISFDGFQKKIDEWYKDKDFELCDPPISAQFALDLIFKTLVDDREDYPYLTTMSENTEQTNSIMLDLILRKYSRKYRKYLKLKKKNK